jgi:hypothetical protein
MNLLDAIKRALGFQDWKETSALPGWRSRPNRMRHARTPYSSSRQRGPGAQRMSIEEFADKERRDERFRELRAKGTPHVSKFSTVDESNHSVWCVVRP